MDEFLSHVIRTLTEGVEDIESIRLYGSQVNPQVVDMWSDYDLWIVLHSSARIDQLRFIQTVNDIGIVVGSELHRKDHSVLYRTAIAFESSMRLLDATVSHEEPPSANLSVWPIGMLEHLEPRSTPNMLSVTNPAPRADETRISLTWFKYMGAINKFCRHDNLIGMHLLLDLIREFLVLEMVERDNRKKTNIHRYGSHELLPEPIRLSNIYESDPKRLLDYIAKLAYAYDQKIVSMVEGYTSRVHWILEYIERSQEHLLK